MQEKETKQRALFRAAQRKRSHSPCGLERPEDVEVENRSRTRCANRTGQSPSGGRFAGVYSTFPSRLGCVCCGIGWFLHLMCHTRLPQLAVLWSLVLAPNASAYQAPPKLAEVVHAYSLGVGELRCASRAEWDGDFASAVGRAYTNMRDDYAVLGPGVCEGALNVGTANVPLWQQALGALVLTHEAFHLRRWRFRRNEGKVECQAIVYFKDAAQRLGRPRRRRKTSIPTRSPSMRTRSDSFRPTGTEMRDPPWAPPG